MQLTFHAIKTESFTKFVDDDEEDGGRIFDFLKEKQQFNSSPYNHTWIIQGSNECVESQIEVNLQNNL